MKQIKNFRVTKILLSILFIFILGGKYASAQSYNIKNDSFWDTKDGKPIYSQGGGVFKFLSFIAEEHHE